MTRRRTWLEDGHHIPFLAGIALSCWERGLALVPSLGPWGTQLRQPQILWVANSLCCSWLWLPQLHAGLRDICLSLGKCKWGQRTQSPSSLWLIWAGLASGEELVELRWLLMGWSSGAHWQEQGWSPLSVGFNKGYGLEETSCTSEPDIPIIPMTILLVCRVSSKPSRGAPSLRPPRSQSRSAQFPSFPHPLSLSWLFKNLRSCCSTPFLNWEWYKNPSSSANMHSCHIEHTFKNQSIIRYFSKQVKIFHFIKAYIYIILVMPALLYMVNTPAKIGCAKKLLIRQKSEPKFNWEGPASFAIWISKLSKKNILFLPPQKDPNSNMVSEMNWKAINTPAMTSGTQKLQGVTTLTRDFCFREGTCVDVFSSRRDGDRELLNWIWWMSGPNYVYLSPTPAEERMHWWGKQPPDPCP